MVGIKHNNRKENCAGSEDVTRDHRCAHLVPSVTPLARTSRLMRRRRYSHVDGRRLLAGLGSAASSGLRGRRRLPAQGPRCRSPSGSGSRRHRPGESPPPRVEVMEPRPRSHRLGSTTAHALGQPSSSHAPSLMNLDGA